MRTTSTALKTDWTVSQDPAVLDPSLGPWATEAQTIAIQKALANISPSDGQPGSILASPSRSNPDYYYHWTRDGARTMRTFEHLYETSSGSIQQQYDELLLAYTEFTKLTQTTPTVSNSLGEPKFYVTGQDYSLPWGRPQNDGPGQRALILTRWAQRLLLDGQQEYVTGVLYDGQEPSFSVIKADLDFIGNHWGDHCFDLWEEVDGTHFYTRMQQRAALREGAALASQLGDGGAATFYNQQAEAIEGQMGRFWNASTNTLLATIDRVGGIDYKSGLDSCVVIASCETYSPQYSFFPPNDDRVLATAYVLSQTFDGLYPINQVNQTANGYPIFPAIGRYPEDTYNGGSSRAQGNPWFLCTLALSGLCYKSAILYTQSGSITVSALNVALLTSAAKLVDSTAILLVGETVTTGMTKFSTIVQGLVAMGDAYLQRVRLHGAQDGSLSEQFDRTTGYMMSARDLTWSYMALALTAEWRVNATSLA